MTTSLPLEKYTVGNKLITIRDPNFFISQINSGAFVPLIKTLKVAKEDVVMYTLNIKNVNADTILDVAFELPESMSNTIVFSASETVQDGIVPVWETNDSISEIFKRDINRILEFFLNKVKAVSTFDEEPTIYYPGSRYELKWPWKNNINDYESRFDPAKNVHVIRFGVAYFNPTKKIIGATLQLGGFPGRTLGAINAAKLSKKRARTQNLNEEDTELDNIVEGTE